MRKTFTIVGLSHTLGKGQALLTRIRGEVGHLLLGKTKGPDVDLGFVFDEINAFRRECNETLDDLCIELAQRGAKRGRR